MGADQPTMGDSGSHRRAVFRRGAARISELHINLADRHTTSMIRLDRIRQLKQLLLGGFGRRERIIVLEFHFARKSLKRASSTMWSVDKIAPTRSDCGAV
jgi:hypothetical protein